MTLVVRSRVVGSSKESMHWRRSVAATAILSVPLRSLVVSALFLLLFSLTLGVGVLILCDRRLRMMFRSLVTNRTAEPDRFRMNRSNGLWKRQSTRMSTESIHSSHSAGFVERIVDRRAGGFAADSLQKTLKNLAGTDFIEICTTFAQHQIDRIFPTHWIHHLTDRKSVV